MSTFGKPLIAFSSLHAGEECNAREGIAVLLQNQSCCLDLYVCRELQVHVGLLDSFIREKYRVTRKHVYQMFLFSFFISAGYEPEYSVLGVLKESIVQVRSGKMK